MVGFQSGSCKEGDRSCRIALLQLSCALCYMVLALGRFTYSQGAKHLESNGVVMTKGLMLESPGLDGLSKLIQNSYMFSTFLSAYTEDFL